MTKHGMSQTPIYHVWENMKSRCLNPAHPSYKDYGARGISVDPRWMEFSVFYADMGDVPGNLELDRIDNDRGYSKDNCRWATATENTLNRRNARMVTAYGRTMHIREWAFELGLNPRTIEHRIYAGLPVEEILSTKRLAAGSKRVSGTVDTAQNTLQGSNARTTGADPTYFTSVNNKGKLRRRATCTKCGVVATTTIEETVSFSCNKCTRESVDRFESRWLNVRRLPLPTNSGGIAEYFADCPVCKKTYIRTKTSLLKAPHCIACANNLRRQNKNT